MMRECRFYPWCSYIEDHGCTKDSCRHYKPMPDVDALAKLADEIDLCGRYTSDLEDRCAFEHWARSIREALGVKS